MISRWLDETIAYDGSQLRAHWILRHTGIAGDAVVAFRGPCDVTDAEMADLEDLLHGPGIAADDMVHVLIELFDESDLLRSLYFQRLVSALAGDTLLALAPGQPLRRDGDDLFLADGKLSISIATRSLVSTLFHFAVNVSNAGTPVRTAALEDLSVDPEVFARRLIAAIVAEHASVAAARVKVRGKGESN